MTGAGVQRGLEQRSDPRWPSGEEAARPRDAQASTSTRPSRRARSTIVPATAARRRA